ncbi:HEPN domain-containing protein [candidate division KSB1 bacterium]|nr:HEPN domain-containing protein [candidate division KSB1 bacterium]
MNAAEHIAYWQTLAESDLEVARRFLQRGENLHYCLFFGHMSLEKLLKGLIVARTHEMPPKIHDLLRLADKATLPLEKDVEERLKIFNSFNLEARYPDYKLSFYKLCTAEFAHEHFIQIEEVYKWIKDQFPQTSS